MILEKRSVVYIWCNILVIIVTLISLMFLYQHLHKPSNTVKSLLYITQYGLQIRYVSFLFMIFGPRCLNCSSTLMILLNFIAKWTTSSNDIFSMIFMILCVSTLCFYILLLLLFFFNQLLFSADKVHIITIYVLFKQLCLWTPMVVWQCL